MIKASINLSNWNKMVKIKEKKLLFALKNTVDQVAVASVKQIKTNMERTYTLRSSWYKKGRYAVKMRNSNTRNLTAYVYTKAPWLQLHESGGVKKPKGGGQLAVPRKYVGRKPKGGIKKSYLPSQLAKSRAVKKRGRKALIIGSHLKRGAMRLLYTLTPKAKIKPTLNFRKTVESTHKKLFKKLFVKHFKRELSKAR